MLYCEKCRSSFEDGNQKCPTCGRVKSVRPIVDDDMVYLNSADEYTANLAADEFKKEGIVYSLEKFGSERVSYIYDSEVMPTDKSIYVRASDLPRAMAIIADIRMRVDAERENEEQFEDMPQKKRMWIQIISLILFLIVVAVIVLGADWIANFFKNLFYNNAAIMSNINNLL